MQVKVWNDNVHPYTELFREKKVYIAPKGFIWMEEDEANLFRGTMNSIKRDVDGNPLPTSYKMIRIEHTQEAAPVLKKDLCIACGYEGASAQDLSEHVKASHAGQEAPVDEEAERVVKAKKKIKAA